MEGAINGKRVAAAVGMSLVLAAAASATDVGAGHGEFVRRRLLHRNCPSAGDQDRAVDARVRQKRNAARYPSSRARSTGRLPRNSPRPTYKKQREQEEQDHHGHGLPCTRKRRAWARRETPSERSMGASLPRCGRPRCTERPIREGPSADDWAVYGVNNYGTDNMTDTSMRVGRAGTATIDVSFVGCLWTYRGSFTRANRVSEVYWNRTARSKVC
jgi:hypothetical protein